MVSPLIAALIVAAGRGVRAGTQVPKQYVQMGDKTVLRHTVDRFLELPEIGRLTVVISERDRSEYSEVVAGVTDNRLTAPVIGGETRAHSVRAGLNAMTDNPPDQVLIHDAARPFVAAEAIRGVIDILKVHDGAFVAVPVVDALWRTDGGFAISPQDRTTLWRAQTPQGFRYQRILEAHNRFEGVAADDVEVARASGMLVQIVEGSEMNFKITTSADLVRARAQLAYLNENAED